MKLNIASLLLALPFVAFSQKFERKKFDYDKLKTDSFIECNDSLKEELMHALGALRENNSKKGVELAQRIYDTDKSCYQVFEVYGRTLFRSGEWFEGVDIVEKGIEKFGSVPELIKQRSEMSIEMARLGTGQKSIDGNAVYKANAIKYDEDEFREENLKSALDDLEYLMVNYKRSEEVFYVAKIHQLLKHYDQSTEIFKTLLNDEEYGYGASFNIADNDIIQNKYAEAETELTRLLAQDPKDVQVLNKLSELYVAQKDTLKAKEYRNKSLYYENVPVFSDLAYSNENFELLVFFGTDEHNASDKLKRLNDIVKQNNQAYTIDVCLIILKLHTNHGNGIEERATDILAEIGKPAITKVNMLFQTDVSTCTITNLADIMATVKQDSSWELMKVYLAYIATMPSTLIPPDLPAKMIKFNEDKGVREILLVVKPLLTENNKDGNPMNGFGQYVYYSPLKKISKSKLKKIATELQYTDKEYKQLQEEIKSTL